MADTNTDAGKSFVANVIAKLPTELQAQARAVFEASEAQAALDEAGRGYRSLAETSRLADEAKAARERAETLYSSNKVWYDANLAEVQAAAQMRARLAELEENGGKPPVTPPAPPVAPAVPDAKHVTVDDFQTTVAESLGLFGVIIPRLQRRHDRLFGEELPMEELIAEAQRQKLPLEKAYEIKYAAQLKTKADEAEAARVKTIEDAAIARFQREHPQMPYPSPRGGGGSPLDSLPKGAPVEPGANLVDESVALYNELVAQKAGA